MTVSCPSCGRKIDSLADQKGFEKLECASCGKVFSVSVSVGEIVEITFIKEE